MRSLNWNNIQASSDDGGFVSLPAGPYVARIIDATDNPDREYVEVVWDIAEGEHTAHYDDAWGQAHPYAHHFFMSYKERALGMLKGRLEAIAASNPGFDPFAAWDAGRLDIFTGRLVGINVQEEEYERNGEVKTRLNVCQIVDAQRVRDGKVKAREKKTLGGRPAAPASKASIPYYDGEIPFD